MEVDTSAAAAVVADVVEVDGPARGLGVMVARLFDRVGVCLGEPFVRVLSMLVVGRTLKIVDGSSCCGV